MFFLSFSVQLHFCCGGICCQEDQTISANRRCSISSVIFDFERSNDVTLGTDDGCPCLHVQSRLIILVQVIIIYDNGPIKGAVLRETGNHTSPLVRWSGWLSWPLEFLLFVCHVKSILRCHLQAFRVFICQRKGLFERTYPCNYIVLTFLDRSPFVEIQPLKDVTGLKM